MRALVESPNVHVVTLGTFSRQINVRESKTVQPSRFRSWYTGCLFNNLVLAQQKLS